MKTVLFNYAIDGCVETQKTSDTHTEYSRNYKYIGSIYFIDGESVEYVTTLSFIGVYDDVPEKVKEVMYLYNALEVYELRDTCISFSLKDKQVMTKITEQITEL